MLIYARDSLKILAANERARQKYGYSPEEFTELTLMDLRPGEDVEDFKEIFKELNREIPQQFDLYRHRTKSGEVFYVKVSSSSYDFQNVPARIVVINDITHRVEAVGKARHAYEELNQHISNSPLAYIKWDQNFRIEEWSSRAEEISGYSKKEMLGKTPFALEVTDPRKIAEFTRRTRDIIDGVTIKDQIDIRFRAKNGDIKDLRIYFSAMTGSGGELESVVTLIEDVTDENEWKRQLESHYKLSDFLNRLNNVINNSSDHREALKIVLRKICEFIEWPVGHIYQLDEKDRYLSTDIWHISGGQTYEFLQQSTQENWFEKGKGFIGRVIQEDKPLLTHGLDDSTEFIRKGEKDLGVCSCFAFPVHANGQIEVVLEFFHPERKEPDDFFYEAIINIENQLARILERSKARLQLKKSEQKYRRLFENANDGIFIMKGKQFIDCNEEVSRIYGADKSEIIGKTPMDFSPEYQYDGTPSAEKAEKKIRLVMGGEPQVFEWLHSRPDGSQIDVEVSLNRLELSEGTYIQAIVRDITKEKEDQRELDKRQKMLETLFLRSTSAIALVGLDNRVRVVNESFEQLFGYKGEEAEGKDIDALINYRKSDDEAAVLPGNISPSGVLYPEVERYTKSGDRKQVMLGAIPIYLEDELLAGYAIYTDITEQKRAEREIKKREALFRNLFLKAPAAMVMVDAENKVQMINNSFEELFGYTEKELLGEDLDHVIVPEGKYDEAPKMPGDFSEGKLYSELTRRTKSGREINVLLGAIPVFFEGEPLAGFGMYIDITDRKRSEQQLKHSLREKRVLLEEIHHRVKNNLAIISGILELQRFDTDDTKVSESLHDSQLRIKSIALVHEMLYQTDNFSDISFSDYVRQLMGGIESTLPNQTENIDIEVNSDDIRMNINQAIPCALLINELVTNAFKHAFDQSGGVIKVILTDEGDYIEVTVADNGVGMPGDFDLNSNRENTLGLNLIKTLSEQLEADLSYRRDGGSVFSFSFELKSISGAGAHHLS